MNILLLWLVLALLLSLGGVVAFILLFVRDMTVYWFILSPLIIIVYQFPALVVFRIWKRKREKSAAEDAPTPALAEERKADAPDAGGSGMTGGSEKG